MYTQTHFFFCNQTSYWKRVLRERRWCRYLYIYRYNIIFVFEYNILYYIYYIMYIHMNTINNTSFGCGHDIDILYTHIIYAKRCCRQALVISRVLLVFIIIIISIVYLLPIYRLYLYIYTTMHLVHEKRIIVV